MKIGIECGERWWRLSSWRRWSFFEKRYRWQGFRKWPTGFAFGPIMVWRKK